MDHRLWQKMRHRRPKAAKTLYMTDVIRFTRGESVGWSHPHLINDDLSGLSTFDFYLSNQGAENVGVHANWPLPHVFLKNRTLLITFHVAKGLMSNTRPAALQDCLDISTREINRDHRIAWQASVKGQVSLEKFVQKALRWNFARTLVWNKLFFCKIASTRQFRLLH